MRGFMEVKESMYEDVIEHLKKIKLMACKTIKALEEYQEEEDEEEYESRGFSKNRGRYNY